MRNLPFPYTLHQFGILGHPIEDGVLLLEELVGGVKLLDEALVQHHDLVIVQDGVQPAKGHTLVTASHLSSKGCKELISNELSSLSSPLFCELELNYGPIFLKSLY